MKIDGDTKWDVIVVGGGPAGMMAAGRAAELGKKVLLLEKNKGLGKKLLITGGGRCNVTNAEPDTRKLLAKFKTGGKFLFSPFSQFAVKEALEFFHSHGCPTKVEAELRVFPESDRAASVWKVLVDHMDAQGVTVLTGSPVCGFALDGNAIAGVRLSKDRVLFGRSVVLATGGQSRPETGSTGEGFEWLKGIGHTVIGQEAALVPIAVKDPWIKKLAGISLSAAKFTLYQNGVKQDKREGKLLFTHVGLSGPAILNASKDIGELLKYGGVTLAIDILPTLDTGALNKGLERLLRKESNKKVKNILALFGSLNGTAFPTALGGVALELSGIDPDTFCHSVTRTERLKLAATLKGMPFQVSKLLGLDKAVVTSGGVDLKEIDLRAMRSLLHPNLYLVGDTLNIDRPSGGYSLQLCWTTGYVAGTHAASDR